MSFKAGGGRASWSEGAHAGNPRTKSPEFQFFDSSVVLVFWGGISRPMGNFQDILTPRISVGGFLISGWTVGHMGHYVFCCTLSRHTKRRVPNARAYARGCEGSLGV